MVSPNELNRVIALQLIRLYQKWYTEVDRAETPDGQFSIHLGPRPSDPRSQALASRPHLVSICTRGAKKALHRKWVLLSCPVSTTAGVKEATRV